MGRLTDITNGAARQAYYLPMDVIDYLIKYSNFPTPYKLMLCCKSLRIQQIRIGKGHIRCLSIRQTDTILSAIAREALSRMPHLPEDMEISNERKLQIEFSVIKVWQVLMLRFLDQIQFDSIMFKLDLSQTQRIFIYTENKLHDWVVEKLAQSSVKRIYVTAWFQDCTQMFYQFFEKCPNADYIE